MDCNNCYTQVETNDVLRPENNHQQEDKPVVEKVYLGKILISNKHGIRAFVFGLIAPIAFFLNLWAIAMQVDFLAFITAGITVISSHLGVFFGTNAMKVFLADVQPSQGRPLKGFVLGLIGLDFSINSMLIWMGVMLFTYGNWIFK